MNLRPLGDRVLIKPDVNPEQTASGLWLSEHKKPEESGTVIAVGSCEHPRRAEVLAVADAIEREAGPDAIAIGLLRELVKSSPLVNVGDYVLFSWAVGQEILIDDDRYLLMRESDILAVCEGVPA